MNTPTDLEQYKEKIQQFRLMDDEFMTAVFGSDPKVTEYVVNTILGRDDIDIIEVRVQHSEKNLQGHSLVLDVLAVDSRHKYYNVEIQRSDRGAGRTRARYHSSILDSRLLPSGETGYRLPETFIIFITEHDVMGRGQPLYHIERVIQETGALFEDGEHIIYVNGAYEGDDAMGRLMNDFRVRDPKQMYSTVLMESAKHFKETEEGVRSVSRIMEEMLKERMLDFQRKTIEKYLRNGKSPEEIHAFDNDYSLDFIRGVQQEIQLRS